MQYNPPQFYRPYADKEDEATSRARSNSSMTNETTSTTDTDDTQVTATTGTTKTSGKSSIVGMDTGDTFDPRYELIRAAGPSMNTVERQYEYNFGKSLSYSQYPPAPPPPFPNKDSLSLLQKNPTTRSVATLYSINSQNRNTTLYPYASYFSLQLPRSFKNVSAFNIVQISFPTLSGVIPDNTNAINLEILRQIIPGFFDISQNTSPNLCEPQTNTVDQISQIIDGEINPTSLKKNPYNLCTAETTAACALGVGSCLDSMFISEEGRTNPVSTNEILKLIYPIEPGRYISDTLVDALNSSMNSTMYFEIINFADYKAKILAGEGAIVGFPYPLQYFYNNLTGRYSTLDDPVTGRDTLAAFYYPSIDTIFSLPPTNQEIFVSYYYPVLKEACINPNLRYMLDYSGYDVNQVYSQVVTGFLGLNNSTYVGMCGQNAEFLDRVRKYYTQEYYAVNQYTWYYNPIKNRIGVTFNTLNRSIRTTVSINYSNYFNEALSFYSIDLDTYNAAKANLASQLTGLPVVEQMAALFAQNMGILGVQVQDYTFNDISSNLTLFNTENITELVPGFNIFQEKAGSTNQSSYSTSPNPYYAQWPNMKNLATPNFEFFQDLSAVLTVDTNYPYSVDAQKFLNSATSRYYAVDPSDDFVYVTNGLYTDLFVNVGRYQYVIVPFRTPNKQNVQVATLSRPFLYRYPAFNLSQGGGSSGYYQIDGIGQYGPLVNSVTFGGEVGSSYGPYDYFNYFDSTTEPKFDTIPMSNYNLLYNIAFHSTLQSALASVPFNSTFQVNFLQPFNYFRIEPPIQASFDTTTNPQPAVYWDLPYSSYYPSSAPTLPQVSSRYIARLTIVPVGSTTFSAGMIITIYNNYTLFTADLNKGINNSSVNYKYSFEVSAGDTSGNIDFPIYSHCMNVNNLPINKYYYIKISQKEEVQTAQSYQLALWNEKENIKLYQGLIVPNNNIVLPKAFNEYTWEEVYAGSKQSGLMSYWHACVLDPDFNAAGFANGVNPLSYPFNRKIPMFQPFIGHDTNGISTDLTDYRGFYTDSSGYNPDAEYYADPVSGYYFKQLSDYSDTTHTYFYSGSENAVYNPSFSLYSFSGTLPSTLKREFKFVHWWDTHFIGPQNYQYYSSLLGTSVVPNLSFLQYSNLISYNQAQVSGSPILYGYSYFDWATFDPVNFPTLTGNTTLFDFAYSTIPLALTPPTPPTYDDTRNVLGFTFSLPDGIYNLKQFTFKSAYFGSAANDPNEEIEKLFIFNAGSINQQTALTTFGGDLKIIVGTQTGTTFSKDFTGQNNISNFCADGDFALGTTRYEINLSNPFNGQNFLIRNNCSVLPITIKFITDVTTAPLILPGGAEKFFSYRFGRWNYYDTIPGFGQINSFDYNNIPYVTMSRKSRVSYGPGGNAANPNADKNYGTYYTFEIDTNYSNPEFFGTQLPSAQFQANAYSSYVCVAITTVDIPTFQGGIRFYGNKGIWLLAGSLVPHPEAMIATGSSSTPVAPWPSTNGDIPSPYEGQANEQSMIIPSPTGSPPYITGNIFESQFGQSMPISTCGILTGTSTPSPSIAFAAGFNPTYNISYQSFWPVQNIIFERVATTYKPMTELNTIVNPSLLNSNGEPITDSSGSFEYPRSQLFYYDNLADLYADISDATDGYRWGFETRYKASSVNFNGYKNNAYIYDITPNTDSVGYLLLRAYSPSEQYQTMLRFAIKETSNQIVPRGLYSFGLKTTDMITSEYLDLIAGAKNFAPDYAAALTEFWQSFIGSFVFGINNLTFDGFNILTFDINYFLDSFRTFWKNLQDDIAIINKIDNYTLEKINTFIDNQYSTVLPPNLLTYSALNGDTSLPVTFYGNVLNIQNSTPFSDLSNCSGEGLCNGITSAVKNSFSCFPAGATIPTLEVQVGFPFATVTAVGTLEGDTNNIINQNLYMQMNVEQTFNNMDVALNEETITTPLNLCAPKTLSGIPSSVRTQNSVISTLRNQGYSSKEFSGSSKIANGKIILNNATDNVTQTYVQSPTSFSPPLGKLETLYFKVLTKDLYPVYQVYPYVTPELEWNGIISITEEVSNVVPEEITQVARINVDPKNLPF